MAEEARVAYLSEQKELKKQRINRSLKRTAMLIGVSLFAFFLFWIYQDLTSSHYKPKVDKNGAIMESKQESQVPQDTEAIREKQSSDIQEEKGKRDSHLIRVSISENGFYPVGMKMAVVGHASVHFSGNRPAGISRMPDFEGDTQRFGVLRLGTRDNDRFPFAFDLLPSGHPVMYVDVNQNGDFSDDGAPLANQGTGWFGARVGIPFEQLVDEIEMTGTYRTWLFMKEKLWESGVFRRYSFTQLQGNVFIDGEAYDAFIADSYTHDADYTNDGIGIDLDRNGKIDRNTEFFPPNSTAGIGGRRYVFVVEW